MNIFVIDPNPETCASMLDDKRVVKMTLETAQILSNASRNLHGLNDDILYKPTHVNHPCCKWASCNNGNYSWLVEYMGHLLENYETTHFKKHACFEIYNKVFIRHKTVYNENIKFVNCTKYKNVENVFLAYRLALLDKWFLTDVRVPIWKTGPLKNVDISNDSGKKHTLVKMLNDHVDTRLLKGS